MLKHTMACAKIATLSVLLSGCVIEPSSSGGDEETLVYGGSRADAIEVCKSDGADDYLSRLRCPAGQPVSARPAGSSGPRNRLPQNATGSDQQSVVRQANSYKALRSGETDYHTVDAYDVTCSGETRRFYFDRYHCEQGAPTEAPRGYSLTPAEGDSKKAGE